ncbi:amino acid/amide ABC transporter membrane protein 2 (HAAT family) [Sphaerotilus hippei]|uniref:Amino acid/amide ABC transporter membrane protein 2 (HAAT family) n=1 Tax=Sphaerotilus hippei TaxID=744406 RepID=A0A318HE62_9BURK|nr:branched-chain amino acid ABC transporter permease [Sphaerotilus hippei]PXW97993.1 amino acid/amide ABC transporter membrane protein 2 (HAAT family) [Sphaerotilus hippei]
MGVRFRSLALGWGALVLALVAAPLVWSGGFAHALLAQMGIAVIVCLSYHLLLGEGGMYSFGHAVYSGLGAYAAMQALRHLTGEGGLPVSLVPLAGGLAALLVAVPLGYLSTLKSGTAFAMITLGLGELVAALVPMLPDWFGGEEGLSGNRVVGAPVLGISFGPSIELCYLIFAYAVVSAALMRAYTRTPAGLLLNAVRDRPERVAFLGYGVHRVRHAAFLVSAFFAGVAGGLAALQFEIVTAEVVGAQRSGAYLLFVFLGGTGHVLGPVLGAVLMVLALVLLSALTPAWLLYLGLAFVLMVMQAPGGLIGLLGDWVRRLRAPDGRALRPAALAVLLGALLTLAAAVTLVELLYHRLQQADLGVPLRLAGVPLDSTRPLPWVVATGLLVTAALVTRWRWSRLRPRWHAAPAEESP